MKESNDVSAAKIIESISSICEVNSVANDMGSELSVLVPYEATQEIPRLLDHLDENKSNLGIISYGCSITSLEDVFVKVGELVKNEQVQVSSILSKHLKASHLMFFSY